MGMSTQQLTRRRMILMACGLIATGCCAEEEP